VRKAIVEKFAEKIAEVYKFDVGDSLRDLVDTIGGQIHFQHLDEWIGENGSIFVHGGSDFDILLPHYTSPLRDCFTIGHELGHYFLHSDLGKIPIIAYRQGSTRIEWEANWFAASLLMPSKKFKEAWEAEKATGQLEKTSIMKIAMRFGVSQDAARIRKESLGL
jgi:hypothetical protein